MAVAIKRSALLLAVLLLTACANMLSWQESTPQTYVVKPGDTLFGIAWVYRLDREQLAWANGITDHTKLKVGQELRLDTNGLVGKPRARLPVKPSRSEQTTTQQASRPVAKPKPSTSSTSRNPTTASRPKPTRSPATSKPTGGWKWPYARAVKRNYGAGRHGRDGLGFDVKLGEKVFAAAGGKVVYVGNHHKQLGGLVVIHHPKEVVSAYAFCGKMVVNLGQQVKAGQHIAHVGYNAKGEPAFNFGIRKDGKSQDVLAYLPKR